MRTYAVYYTYSGRTRRSIPWQSTVVRYEDDEFESKILIGSMFDPFYNIPVDYNCCANARLWLDGEGPENRLTYENMKNAVRNIFINNTNFSTDQPLFIDVQPDLVIRQGARLNTETSLDDCTFYLGHNPSNYANGVYLNGQQTQSIIIHMVLGANANDLSDDNVPKLIMKLHKQLVNEVFGLVPRTAEHDAAIGSHLQQYRAHRDALETIERSRAAENAVPAPDLNSNTSYTDVVKLSGEDPRTHAMTELLNTLESISSMQEHIHVYEGRDEEYTTNFKSEVILLKQLCEIFIGKVPYNTVNDMNDITNISELIEALHAHVTGVEQSAHRIAAISTGYTDNVYALQRAKDRCATYKERYNEVITRCQLSEDAAQQEVNLAEMFPNVSPTTVGEGRCKQPALLFTSVYKPVDNFEEARDVIRVRCATNERDAVEAILTYPGTRIIFRTYVTMLNKSSLNAYNSEGMNPHAHYNCLGNYPQIFRRCRSVDELIAAFNGYLINLNTSDSVVMSYFFNSIVADRYPIIVDQQMFTSHRDAYEYIKKHKEN